jgi:hypothetical protein
MRNGKYQLNDFPIIMSDDEWDDLITEWDKCLERTHRQFNRKSTASNGFHNRYDECIKIYLEILQEGFDATEAADEPGTDQSKVDQSEHDHVDVVQPDLTSQIELLCNAGLYLVPIPPKRGQPTKAPVAKGWNLPISEINPWGYSNNYDDFKHLKGYNIGLYHGASNSLALDLDDMDLARQVFEDTTDLNLIAWLANDVRVEIKSPKANRGKLLFKVPVGFSASLRQLKKPKKDKPKEYDVIFELRCGNCQDVVYGQHPEGGHYQLIGNPAVIPEAPPVLLDMLLHWEAWKPCLDSALGIEQEPPKEAPRKPLEGENLKGYRNPIVEFNGRYTVREVLERNGYRPVGTDRYIRPNSSSHAPGIKILTNCRDGKASAWSCCSEGLNTGFALDACDVFRWLEHSGAW